MVMSSLEVLGVRGRFLALNKAHGGFLWPCSPQSVLLLLYCLFLAYLSLSLLQSQVWVYLQTLRQSGISNTYHESISNHFCGQVAVITTADQVVQGSDVLFGCFSLFLVALVEPRPFENHVFSDLKESVEFIQDRFVGLPVVFGDIC